MSYSTINSISISVNSKTIPQISADVSRSGDRVLENAVWDALRYAGPTCDDWMKIAENRDFWREIGETYV